jgi:hypothetical protein
MQEAARCAAAPTRARAGRRSARAGEGASPAPLPSESAGAAGAAVWVPPRSAEDASGAAEEAPPSAAAAGAAAAGDAANSGAHGAAPLSLRPRRARRPEAAARAPASCPLRCLDRSHARGCRRYAPTRKAHVVTQRRVSGAGLLTRVRPAAQLHAASG